MQLGRLFERASSRMLIAESCSCRQIIAIMQQWQVLQQLMGGTEEQRLRKRGARGGILAD